MKKFDSKMFLGKDLIHNDGYIYFRREDGKLDRLSNDEFKECILNDLARRREILENFKTFNPRYENGILIFDPSIIFGGEIAEELFDLLELKIEFLPNIKGVISIHIDFTDVIVLKLGYPEDLKEEIEKELKFKIEKENIITAVSFSDQSKFYRLDDVRALVSQSDKTDRYELENLTAIANRSFNSLLLTKLGFSESNNELANRLISSFISTKINYDSLDARRSYDEIFTGEMKDGENLGDGFNSFISEKIEKNLKKLYLKAKNHPRFKAPEEYTSANNILSVNDDGKKHGTSSSFMSEYLVFLLLLEGKHIINDELFFLNEHRHRDNILRNIIPDHKPKNKPLLDFRIFLDDMRVGIQVKRFFHKLNSNFRTDFKYIYDMTITEINSITFFSENNKEEKLNYKNYVIKNKEVVYKKSKNDQAKDSDRLKLNRVILVKVNKRFLEGSKEDQIKYFNSLVDNTNPAMPN